LGMGGRARGATTLSLGQQHDQDRSKAAQQPSHAVPPEDLEPKDNERGAEDCRPDHCLHWDKHLIPARRNAGDQLFDEIRLVHDLRKVITRLGGLPKGEALEVEIGHVACFAV